MNFFLLFLRDIFRYFQSLSCRASWRSYGVFLAPSAQIIKDVHGEINLSVGVVLSKGVVIVATTERAIEKKAVLTIGVNSVINEYANIRASGGIISIGENSMIAQGVSIIATNHDIDITGSMMLAPWNQTKNEVIIGNDVWIGAHSVLLPGIKIADGAVVGAGSVVNRNIGRYEVWAGIPAKFIRYRKREG